MSNQNYIQEYGSTVDENLNLSSQNLCIVKVELRKAHTALSQGLDSGVTDVSFEFNGPCNIALTGGSWTINLNVERELLI